MAYIIFNSISLLSLFLIFFLLIFFLVTKKGNKISNRFIAVFLFLFGVQVFYAVAVSNYDLKYFLEYHKSLFLVKNFGFLTGPVLYLYIKSFQVKSIPLISILKHGVIFVIAVLVSPIFYMGSSHFIIWNHPIDLISSLLIFSHNLVYIIVSIGLLKKMGKSIRDFFNEFKILTHSSWLQFILISYITIWTVNLNSLVIINILEKPGWCAYTGSVFALISFLFINILMFLLLIKPEIYYILEKYKANSLSEETKNEYLKSLNAYIGSKKPYLNPGLTLELVSKEISINTRYLSQIINEKYNDNFNGFINNLRLQECIKQLSDPYNRKTILEIIYEAGFNSKSSFYVEFKKTTGLTPQEFRIQNQSNIKSEVS